MLWPVLLRTRRRRRLGAAAVASPLVFVAFVILTQPLWAFSVLGRVFPDMLFRVETDAMDVALSFDDGPDDIHTARVWRCWRGTSACHLLHDRGDRALGRPEIG